MTTQRRTFLVARDQAQLNNCALLQLDLRALAGCVVAKNKLHINYVFGCMGQRTFLVNLKNKATGRLVESVVKAALGSEVEISTVETVVPGEKFAPGLRKSAGRRSPLDEAPIEATVERHAAKVFGESGGTALLLGITGVVKTYLYDGRGRPGLALTSTSTSTSTSISTAATTSEQQHQQEKQPRQPSPQQQLHGKYAEESEGGDDEDTYAYADAEMEEWDSSSQSSDVLAPPGSPPYQQHQGQQQQNLSPRKAASDRLMETQRRTFAVVPAEAEGQPNNQELLEQVLSKLRECEVVGKRIRINYLFGCLGETRFLVNLKCKATGRLADSIVKNALGPRWEATPFETQQRGEKFVPGRSFRNRATTSGENKRKRGEATIEREAVRAFGASSGIALLLAAGGKVEAYRYDGVVGLVLGDSGDQQEYVAAGAALDDGDVATAAAAAAAAGGGESGSTHTAMETLHSKKQSPHPPITIPRDMSCDMSEDSDHAGGGETANASDSEHPERSGDGEATTPMDSENADGVIDVGRRSLWASSSTNSFDARRGQLPLSAREEPYARSNSQQKTPPAAASLLLARTSRAECMVEGQREKQTRSEQEVEQETQAGAPYDAWEDSEEEQMAWRFGLTRDKHGRAGTMGAEGGCSEGQDGRARHEAQEPSEVLHTRARAWAFLSLSIDSPQSPQRQQSLSESKVAMIAGLAGYSRTADGDLVACQDRVGKSDNTGSTGRESWRVVNTEGPTRRLSQGMPRSKGLVDRWRKDNALPSRKQKSASFVVDLYNILQQEDSAVISWLGAPVLATGLSEDAFFIRDPKRFCMDIMPRYFSRLHHYTPREYSERCDGDQATATERMLWVFEMELCLHGFRKAVNHSGYSHPLFRNGKPDLLSRIHRSIAFEGDAGIRSPFGAPWSRATPCRDYGDDSPPKIEPKSGRARRGQHVIFKMGEGLGNSHMWVLERPSATEAAEFVRQRCTLDEVVAILSAPPAVGGGCKDAGTCGDNPLPHAPWWYRDLRPDRHDEKRPRTSRVTPDASPARGASSPPSQGRRAHAAGKCELDLFDRMRSYNVFDSPSIDDFRSSLQKVLQHLGFQLECQEDKFGRQEPSAPLPPPAIFHTAAGMVYGRASPAMRWGGTSAMSFEDCSTDFHESLRQLPFSWRSFLSSIVSCLGAVADPSTSYAQGDADGRQRVFGRGGVSMAQLESRHRMGVVDVGNTPGGSRKRKWNAERIESRASLEILQSVMRETLGLDITRSLLGGDEDDEDNDDEEAMAAAAATRAIGSMCRAQYQSLWADTCIG